MNLKVRVLATTVVALVLLLAVVGNVYGQNTPSLCLLPPDTGPCRAAFPMFNYDSQTHSCRRFTYGGCQGNGNRFSSLKECMKTCGLRHKTKHLQY